MDNGTVLKETDQLLKELTGKLKPRKKKPRRTSKSHLKKSSKKKSKIQKLKNNRKLHERLTFSVGVEPILGFGKHDHVTRRETFGDVLNIAKSDLVKEQILSEFDEQTDDILGKVDEVFDGLLQQFKI